MANGNNMEALCTSDQLLTLLSKDVSQLSTVELDKLWAAVRVTLTPEEDVACAVVTLAETCVERCEKNIPSDLVHVVLTLQNFLLDSNVTYKVKKKVATLLELWCRKGLVSSHVVCTKVFGFMLQSKKYPVKRIWSFWKVLDNLVEEHEEFLPQLLNMVVDEQVVSKLEGRLLIARFLRENADFAEKLHDRIKMSLPTCKKEQAEAYGMIYSLALVRASQPMKTVLGDVCLRELVVKTLQSPRRGMKFGTLGRQLMTVLAILHADCYKNKVYATLVRVYRLVIWLHLTSANNIYRCNAAVLLCHMYPLTVSPAHSSENRDLLERQHSALAKLLTDRCHVIRIITTREVCRILSIFWSAIPSRWRHSWLKVILEELTSDGSSAEVRRCVYQNIPVLLKNPNSVQMLSAMLPALQHQLHDRDQSVRQSFLQLLIRIKNSKLIDFWKIVHIKHILARLEIENNSVGEKIASLLYSNIMAPSHSNSECLRRMKNLTSVNPTSARNFFAYSKRFLPFHKSFSIMKLILAHLHVNLSVDKENGNKVAALVNWDAQVVQGLLDAVSILWILHVEALGKEENKMKLKELHQLTRLTFPSLLQIYKDLDWGVLSSLLFLGSLVSVDVIRKVCTAPSFCMSRLKALELDGNVQESCRVLVTPLCSWGCSNDIIDFALLWLDEAFRLHNLNSSFFQEKRKKVHFAKETNRLQPMLVLHILDAIFSRGMNSARVLRNVRKVQELWLCMKKVRSLIEIRLIQGTLESPLSDDFLRGCLQRHANLTLHLGMCDATFPVNKCTMKLMKWGVRTVLPRKLPFCVEIMKDLAEVADSMIAVGLADDTFLLYTVEFIHLLLGSDYHLEFVKSIAAIIYRILQHCEAYHGREDKHGLLRYSLPTILVDVLNVLKEGNSNEVEGLDELWQLLTEILVLGIRCYGPSCRMVCTLVTNCIDVVVDNVRNQLEKTKTVKVVKRVQDLPLPAAGLLNIFLRQEVLGVLFVCLLARRFHTKFHSSITWIVCAVQVLYVIALKPGVVRTKELMLASSQASSVVRSFSILDKSVIDVENLEVLLQSAQGMIEAIQRKLRN